MTEERTTVVIIGAGVAGLALGNFLLRKRIPRIILEKRSRQYVEERQRAGVIDTRAVRMFREWGLEERIVGGVPFELKLNFRVDGVTRVLEFAKGDLGEGRFCPQQVLVRNLIDVFVKDGGDLRFECDVSLEGMTTDEPIVRYGDRLIRCDFVAGCDGARGASRAAIPKEQLTIHAHEYGYAWLTILAEVAANHQSMMAIHARGFAGQFTRGPNASRFYLQCPLDGTTEEWTDERVWSELEARFGEPMAARGRIVSKQLVPIRSVVYSPMRHGRLYLLGDAAHLVPPMSAKGMNLALHDADVLAKAVIHHRDHGDASLLEAYSATCLDHVWNVQAFAAWFTNMMHDGGDASHHGAFRHRVARADFERLFTSPAANRLFGELITGLS